MGLFDALFGNQQPQPSPSQRWMAAARANTYTDTPYGATMADKNGVLSQIYNGQGMANQWDRFRRLVPNNELKMGSEMWDPYATHVIQGNQSVPIIEMLKKNPSLLNELLKRDERWSQNYYVRGRQGPTKINPLEPDYKPRVPM